MKHVHSQRLHAGRPAFTLVLSLVILSALVISCVAALMLARRDVASARAHAHSVRAELAVAAALADAEATIAQAITGEGAIVAELQTASPPWSDALPGTTSGAHDVVVWRWENAPSGGKAKWTPTVLVSGVSAEASGDGTRPSADAAEPAWADRQAKIPLWSRPDDSVRAQWIEANSNPAKPGELRVRYAWWVEDLGGLADLRSLGTDLRTADRSVGRQPAQVPLGNLFADTVASASISDSSASAVDARRIQGNIDAHQGLLHHGPDLALLLQQAGESEQAQIRARQFFYRSLPAAARAEAIPAGIMASGPNLVGINPLEDYYQASGESFPQSKADLNQWLSSNDGASARVAKTANWIDLWLPQFAQRRGGFPFSDDYVETLAANLLDYADADQNSSSGPSQRNSNLRFRGVDAMPLVNEFFLAYHWQGKNQGGPPRTIRIFTRTFVELWNPTDQTLQGTIGLKLNNQCRIENLPGSLAGPKPMQQLLMPPAAEVEYSSKGDSSHPISIPPNGFVVFEFVMPNGGPPTYEYAVPDGYAGDPYALSLGFNSSKNTSSQWFMSWNGTLIDQPAGGFEHSQGRLYPNWGQREWKGVNGPALDLSIGQMGDPRANWYIEDRDPADLKGYIWKADYAVKSNWGGRSDKQNRNESFDQTFPSLWPDRGNNSAAGWPALAASKRPPGPSDKGTESYLPNGAQPSSGGLWSDWPANAGMFLPNEPEKAPVHIANYSDGKLRSVVEWGQAFDPSGWIAVDGWSYASGKSAYRSGTDGDPAPASLEAKPQPEPAAGGGYTLAVGRPEFAAFDFDGWRAAQLMDLFAVYPDDSGRRERAGLVNINTAPQEVLRALIADLSLEIAPAAPPLELAAVADNLAADLVVWRRGNSTRREQRQPTNWTQLPPSPSGPLRSLAELSEIYAPKSAERLTLEDRALFGNPKRLQASLTAQQGYRWRDELREELIAQLSNVLTVESRNFRIHAKAEIYQVSPGGAEQVVARRQRVREVQIDPQELTKEGLDAGGPRRIRSIVDSPL